MTIVSTGYIMHRVETSRLRCVMEVLFEIGLKLLGQEDEGILA